jgi:phage-related protein
MMSARFMRDSGRNIDVTAWRYDTPACAVLSDYYGSYLTSPGDRTVDQVNSDFMSNGAVGSGLRNHAKHFGGTEYVPEITEAAMACSGYIAAHH